MATPAPSASAFGGTVLRDSVRLLHFNASNNAIILHAPVAVSTAATGPDTTLRALGGVIELGAGDEVHLNFAKSGTVTTPTFLVTQWFPVVGPDGNLVGYEEKPLCDVGSGYTVGTFAIGTVFAGVAMADGTQPATAAIPVGTETWAKAITCNVDSIPVTNSLILNNMDLIQPSATDDVPSTLRISPLGGATHLRVQQRTGGGGGSMWVFVRRARGGALNK